MTVKPSLDHERAVGWPTCAVAGVDEVGRGPLAGDVIAAAVVLPLHERLWFKELADSKTISPSKRSALYEQIMAECRVGIGRGTLDEIAELNILWASMLAMERAVCELMPPPAHILVDGNRSPTSLNVPATTVIKGDGKSCAIAAASIVAKVTRDREMQNLHEEFPQYGWARNKGYPSREHREALARYGPSPYHRRGFKLV